MLGQAPGTCAKMTLYDFSQTRGRVSAPGAPTKGTMATSRGPERKKSLPMDRASSSTVARLSSYYRLLSDLEADNVQTVSSRRLAERGGMTSAQVRKDLSVFGNFGRRGLGYNVTALRRQVGEILGLTRRWSVALFGAGNLGQALFSYSGFRQQGFHIEAVFDIDADKVGTQWNGLTVRHLDDLAKLARRNPIDIAILAVPESAAQHVADAVVAQGIRGILNFAPAKLVIPDDVAVRDVDLSIAMESLSFSLIQTDDEVKSA